MNFGLGPTGTGASPPPLGAEEGSYGARAPSQRGSYTEGDRSGQPYIPGAREALKPPYSVLSPRSTRREVVESFKTEEEAKTEIFHGATSPYRSASDVSTPRQPEKTEGSVMDKVKQSLGL